MRETPFIAAVIVLSLLTAWVPGIGSSVAAAAPTSGPSPISASPPRLIAPAASAWSWTLLGNQPPPRDGHGLVYDSKADRFILFGGATGASTGTFTNSTWSYDYTTNLWTNVSPVVSPSPRAGFSMVYDSKADRVILFGGITLSGTMSNETWVFNPAADTWTRMSPGPSPAGRGLPAMAYDSGANRTILFGGATQFGPISDTWAYDLGANRWTVLNVSSPEARYLASMTHDPSAGRDILFGGLGIIGITPTFLNDTWSFDYTNLTWTNRSPAKAPPVRGSFALAFDQAVSLAILFGGTSALGGPGGTYNDTWGYDYALNTWANLTPAGGPSPRWLTAMDFDSAGSRTVLFGGTSTGSTAFEDAWSLRLGAPLPTSPRNLLAAAGSGRITLTWQAPTSDGGSPITNYTIYRGTAPGGATLLASVGNIVTYDDTAVSPGTTYYYQVAAVTAAGEGPRSNEASATPVAPPTPPSAPQNLAAAPGDAQVILTWQAPASSGGSTITGYDVYRGTSAGAETLLTSLGVILTYTDTAVTNGVTYYYQVSAVNGVGEGPKSNEVSATPTAAATAPSAPQSLVATAGNAQVTLTWQAPTSNGGAAITNYKVYRGTTSGSEALLTTLGNVLTYTDSAVTNGVTYYYEVSAVNSVGEGPTSSEAHATPAAPVADTTRPSISITSPANQSALTTTTVTVSGTASDNVAVQKVELSTDGTTWTLASGTTSWSGSVTLREGANTIYARATDTSGNVRTVTIAVTLVTPSPTPQGLDPVLLAGILLVVVIAALAVALLLWRRRKKATPPPPPPPPAP